MKTLFICLFFLIACEVKSKDPKKGELQLNDCQKRWRILKLKGQIIGEVLFHAPSTIGCGVLATGSVTLVQRNDGNIYRVIEYCNDDKDFPIGSSVKVKLESYANIPIIPKDPKHCDLLETLFGSIEIKK